MVDRDPLDRWWNSDTLTDALGYYAKGVCHGQNPKDGPSGRKGELDRLIPESEELDLSHYPDGFVEF
jgi:hypothetical protein